MFCTPELPDLGSNARASAAPPWPCLFPNGAVMSDWIPKTSDGRGAGTEDSFEFSPTLKGLEPFRDRLVVIGNLERAGTTIDQIVARKIGQDTPFPSLELSLSTSA